MAGNAKPTFPRLRRSNPLVYGLLAGYTLHEGGGLIANDISGQGNNGTLSGATPPAWGGGAGAGDNGMGSPGYVLGFDGATSYIDCGNFADNLPAFTATCRFRLPSGGAVNSILMAKLSAGGLATGVGWAMYIGAGGSKAVGLIQQSGAIFCNPVAGTSFGSVQNWHHVAFVWTGVLGLIYTDGMLAGTDTVHGSLTSFSNAVNVRIGTDAKNELFWSSNISDAWIWKRALSQTEIASLAEDTFQMVRGSRTIFSSAAPVVVTQQIAAPEIHQGPPMRATPWLQQLPLTDGLRSTASVIQWLQGNSAAGATNFLNNVTAGSFLEVTVLTSTLVGTPPPALTVTDSLGQTYIQAGPYVFGLTTSSGGQVSVLSLSKWYFQQSAAGPCSITVAPAPMLVTINEYRSPGLLRVDSTVQSDGTSGMVGPVLVSATDLVTTAITFNGLFSALFSVSPPFICRFPDAPGTNLRLVTADDVSAYASETAVFASTLGGFGSSAAALGVAYRFGSAPGQQQTKFETQEGPPMRGAPWVVKLIPTEDAWTVQAPPPVVAPPPFDIELHGGPPIRGAPWQQHLPIEDALVVGLRFPKPPTPPPTPGKGAAKPFIERWPDVSDPRRLGRITDKISSMINSLAGQALIQKTGPSSFLLRASAIQLARAPTAADDVTTGATVGTVWINTVTQQLWICVANAQGAAVWRGPI